MARRPSKRFSSKVVGLTFQPDYPENLHDLAHIQRRRERRGDDEDLPVVLIRNPDNEHDANAIEIHQPSVGMLGHLPAAVAERLAPCLDAGETWQAWLEPVRISPEAEDKPGVNVYVEFVLPPEEHPLYEEYLSARIDEGAR